MRGSWAEKTHRKFVGLKQNARSCREVNRLRRFLRRRIEINVIDAKEDRHRHILTGIKG